MSYDFFLEEDLTLLRSYDDISVEFVSVLQTGPSLVERGGLYIEILLHFNPWFATIRSRVALELINVAIQSLDCVLGALVISLREAHAPCEGATRWKAS